MRCSQFAQIMELVNISERTPNPVQMDTFCESGSNKMNKEILVREQLRAIAKTFSFSTVSSGMVFDNDVVLDACGRRIGFARTESLL